MIAPSCTLCDKPLQDLLLEIVVPDRFELSVGVSRQGYRRWWMRCSACGLVSNILPNESIRSLNQLRNAYYEVDLSGADLEQKYSKIMALPDHMSDNAGRVERVLQRYKQSASKRSAHRILDIGAGTGVFLRRFQLRFMGELHAVAVEPDPKAAEHLRALGTFEVINAPLASDLNLKDFNLITLNKVLEHIPTPREFLIEVVRCLDESEGLIYIEVPDRLTIEHRPPHDNILGSLHCHLYDPQSLATLARSVGLEPSTIERIMEPSGKITCFMFAKTKGQV